MPCLSLIFRAQAFVIGFRSFLLVPMPSDRLNSINKIDPSANAEMIGKTLEIFLGLGHMSDFKSQMEGDK